jgi:predicted ester cyclase
MTSAENQEVMRRVFEELWNDQQRALIDELYSENLRSHGFGAEEGDLQTYKEYFDLITSAFPDIEFEVGRTFSDGEMVAATWTASGTHKGELMGIEPTGNASTVTGISVSRFEEGRIVEAWMNFDSLKMMQNIGAAPEPAPADD